MPTGRGTKKDDGVRKPYRALRSVCAEATYKANENATGTWPRVEVLSNIRAVPISLQIFLLQHLTSRTLYEQRSSNHGTWPRVEVLKLFALVANLDVDVALLRWRLERLLACTAKQKTG